MGQGLQLWFFSRFRFDVGENHVHKMHKIKLRTIDVLHTKRFITPF